MISTQDDVVDAFNYREEIYSQKTSGANKLAGGIFSFWRSVGIPTQPAIPGIAEILTDATPGAITGPLEKTAGREIRLGALRAYMSANIGEVYLWDRLCHVGGLSGLLNTTQTINLSLPARVNENGMGVQWYLEWYLDTGATVANATISYTNQNGVAGQIAVVPLTASMRADRLMRILPTGADTGIKSIESVTLTASTGIAGSFGVTAIWPIQTITLQTPLLSVEKDYAACCLAPVNDSAHLMLAAIFTGAAASIITVSGTLIRG